MRCTFATHNVNRVVSGLQMGPKQAMCAVQCASQKTLLRCNAVSQRLICTLTAEIPCDVDHNASVAASAMPRCGELKQRVGRTGGPVAECGGEGGFCEGIFAVSARKLVGIVVG